MNRYLSIILLFISLIIPWTAWASYSKQGTASYYTVESCLKESGQYTMANQRRLQDDKFTVASWDYPFGTKLRITNTENNRSVICEVTDRGPAKKYYKKGRIFDLSLIAMETLGGKRALIQGLINVKAEVIR